MSFHSWKTTNKKIAIIIYWWKFYFLFISFSSFLLIFPSSSIIIKISANTSFIENDDKTTNDNDLTFHFLRQNTQ